MNISRFYPYKCIRNQIWPCHKVGQGQARCKPGRDHMPNITYQVPRPLAYVTENKTVKGFLLYMGVVALTFETYL